jgi:DNA helicase MCM9
MIKMLETKRLYECGKCKCHFVVHYDRESHNQVLKPTKCPGGGGEDEPVCESNKFKLVPTVAGDLPGSCKDYQEIKLQEQVNKLAVGYYCALIIARTIPRSINIVLEDDLVDCAKAGDDVTISGLIFQRWRNMNVGDRCDVEVAMLANSCLVHNEQKGNVLTDEFALEFEAFWNDHAETRFDARDFILKSVCPKIYGLYLVKLAVMLVLVGGVAKYDQSGVKGMQF